MSEADPRRLGVHAAISVPGVPDEVLPEYVPRDADAAGHGVRAKVAAAAERGGFVLLVGGSSVGKTRCAAEAVKALLPDWWLVHPAGPAEVAALAAAPPPRTVVWLDELQRYLDGEHGLTGGVMRALLDAPDPVVIIGTLWPDRYAAYTAMPEPGGADPHAPGTGGAGPGRRSSASAPEFSPAEQDRARAAAARDRRLAGRAGRGRVRADPDPGGRAAAGRPLGGRPGRGPVRVGGADRGAGCGPARRPRPAQRRPAARRRAGLLHQRPAGRGAGQLVRAGPGLRHRQAARRRRRPGPGRGRHGPGRRVHRGGLPAPARQPGTPLRPRARQHLGRPPQPHPRSRRRRPARGQRQDRLLYRYAIPLYRHAADAGDWDAAWRLAELLARRGDLDGLRARADAGDGSAAGQLARLLAERGDLDELRARADAGDRDAAVRLAELLAERGDLDELRARADAGDGNAAWRLAGLLAERGDLDGQVCAAGPTPATGTPPGSWPGCWPGAGTWTGCAGPARPADAGDRAAAWQLAELLAGRGDLDELRARADAGDRDAARRLAGLLAERGDLDGLRARADAGDRDAAGRLAGLLAEQGQDKEAEAVEPVRLEPGRVNRLRATDCPRTLRLIRDNRPLPLITRWPSLRG